MFKTNRFLKFLFPKYIWELPNSEEKIYLTFDDGPIPEVTEWVLGLLKKENIKATFFCIGENIQKHPEVFKQIISDDHTIGNHTFNHLNGWKTSTKKYLKNVELCNSVFEKYSISNFQSKLFRPPYGKIKKNQAKELIKLGYKIIMWDVLSYDYDNSLNAERCLNNTLKNISTGSIIVFHDSIKAQDTLQRVLPKLIQQLKEKGFVFDKLN
ncbi:polysaccharide deacetylase family protein [Flavobacterium sp.]|uniref:polysaccharide deacetylase family protein n=1 Tax=Flavobacterium sp. TaxID=239 RepID=UPI003D291315